MQKLPIVAMSGGHPGIEAASTAVSAVVSASMSASASVSAVLQAPDSTPASSRAGLLGAMEAFGRTHVPPATQTRGDGQSTFW
jgi:hypothetical protein